MKRTGLAVAYGALFATAAPPALAQTSADAEPQRLEKVEIVGSHIKRADTEGPTPVSTYRREDIEASGAARLGDFLLALPFAGAGGFDDRSTNFNALFGTAALSLRGLGPGATLVLLNGRRLAAYGLALDNDETFVDLNSLPLAAVERVEVLRDGASAIYGADAIGGVVNIVLRRDFAGAEAMARAGQSTRGDARRLYASASLGAGDIAADRYNAFVTVDAQRQEALPMVARSFSRSADQRPRGGLDARSLASSPPTILLPGVDPFAAPDCPADRVIPQFGGTVCAFDPNLYGPLLPQIERIGALAVGSLAPVAELRLYAELAVNRLVATNAIAPSPVQTVVPADAPTNPFGQPATVFWRPLDAGGRRNETTIDFRRAVAGAQGAWRRWEWDLAAGTSTIDTESHAGNQLRSSALLEALRTGALNPFIANNDPAALAAVKAEYTDRFTGRSRFVQAKATTELAQLAHGPLALALGAERRRESFATALDPLTLAGDIGGVIGGAADSSAARGVSAAFAEVNWPAAAGVEVQLAARHDRYSDFGSSTSPKIALRWQPAKALLLRASAGRGFLPPSLPQLNRPRTAFEGVVDPVRCPVTQSVDDCGGGPGVFSQQGNPDLDAERSRQHNFGVVFEPVAGWSASIDIWRVAHIGKIVFGGDYILRNEAAFPGRVIRGPASAEDMALGLPGPIVEFRDTYINVASRDVRGVDVELKGRVASAFGGALSLGASLGYVDRFVERVTPLDAASDQAGGDGRPRLRGQASAEWQRGSWQLGIGARHIGGYRYLQPFDDAPRTVASWIALDLNVGWRGPRDRVSIGVYNAADRDPPFRSANIGYDAALHDPLGRFVSLSWRHSF